MTERRHPSRKRPRPLPVTDDRYRVLQTGYREALLTQLDLLITELQEEGDFTTQQIEAAVRIRLEGGPDALRHHRLAQEWPEEGTGAR